MSAIEFVPLTDNLLSACVDFNGRLKAAGATSVLLPTKASIGGHHVAVETNGTVRGGVLLQTFCAAIDGSPVTVCNIQSPVTEGVVDRRFNSIAVKMLGFIRKRHPFSYAVGMGSEQSPFARLLNGAGWSVSSAPFMFAPVRPSQVLVGLPVFQSRHRSIAARILAYSGTATAVYWIWRKAHRARTRGFELSAIYDWPTETDEIWRKSASKIAFGLNRDRSGLAIIYPRTEPRLLRFALRSASGFAGWCCCLLTKMNGSPHFGNLMVGTVLDGLSEPAARPALYALAIEKLYSLGADLVILNHTNIDDIATTKQFGMLETRSNYVVALSPDLAKMIRARPAGFRRIHITRGDGDGRINL